MSFSNSFCIACSDCPTGEISFVSTHSDCPNGEKSDELPGLNPDLLFAWPWELTASRLFLKDPISRKFGWVATPYGAALKPASSGSVTSSSASRAMNSALLNRTARSPPRDRRARIPPYAELQNVPLIASGCLAGSRLLVPGIGWSLRTRHSCLHTTPPWW